jgi:2-polyprenyl-3-methyl-5-hydroxy-6-metoxy-1,4-benzoquinol methylase
VPAILQTTAVMTATIPTADRSYMLPNSQQENGRLNLQHDILTRTFGLLRAPIDPSNVSRVLDVATGTGIWARDFASKHPDAKIVGLDIESKTEEEMRGLPSNFTFQIGDMNADSTWDTLGKFDLIHARFIGPACEDWPAFIRRCAEHLNPGGWVEMQEFHMPVLSDDPEGDKSKYTEWSHLTVTAVKKMNLDFQGGKHAADLYRENGLEDVTAEDFKMYAGPWDHTSEETIELGKMGQANLARAVRNMEPSMYALVMPGGENKYPAYAEEVAREIERNVYKNYLPVRVSYAKKPN